MEDLGLVDSPEDRRFRLYEMLPCLPAGKEFCLNAKPHSLAKIFKARYEQT